MNHQSKLNDQYPAIVKNYLRKHTVNPWVLNIDEKKKFDNIIVVPAIEEFENTKKLLVSLSENDQKYFNKSLFLFVVNNLKNSDIRVKSDNKKTLNFLHGIIHKSSNDPIAKTLIDFGINVGVVDASSSQLELPDKDGGVGLARKIGMDLALTVFDYNNDKKKILICLDADCTVKKNYLASIVETINTKNTSAAFVQYEHKLPDEPKEKLAIICYEMFLRYYLLGLIYARSQFAVPTIGSTMVCDYESYIKIGGMNKKKAAEDFYFMEKLAKITRIEKIDSTKVYPSSRGSWRVPFGTGQRVNRFLQEVQDEYVLYNPGSFNVLKEWLNLFNSKEILSAGEYLSEAKVINQSLHKFLLRNSFEESWNKILRSSKSEEQIQKQKLMWFDGFRTLKLIHFLRDNGFPIVDMFEALDTMFAMINFETWIERDKPVPPVQTQLEYLIHLRALTYCR